MSTRPTKSEISIWRDFFGSADSSSSSVRTTYSPPPRSKPACDAVARHLVARPLVDLLVADAVGGPFLELVEVDALVGGRRVQPDRDVDQAEAERPLPDRACHGRQITSWGPVHHLDTAIRHTDFMSTSATGGFGPTVLVGLAELGPVDPTSGDLSLELGLSVWMRRSGISLEEARRALLALREHVIEACGLDPATEPVPFVGPVAPPRRGDPYLLPRPAAPSRGVRRRPEHPGRGRAGHGRAPGARGFRHRRLNVRPAPTACPERNRRSPARGLLAGLSR